MALAFRLSYVFSIFGFKRFTGSVAFTFKLVRATNLLGSRFLFKYSLISAYSEYLPFMNGTVGSALDFGMINGIVTLVSVSYRCIFSSIESIVSFALIFFALDFSFFIFISSSLRIVSSVTSNGFSIVVRDRSFSS